MTTFALIPAAGKSTRMGRPKLSLPLGDRTVLGHVIAALRRANIEHILVVIGPHVPELVPIVEAADADYLLLSEETPDMRATIEAGLKYLQERFAPSIDDALLLVPGDHPTLHAGVVDLLFNWRRSTHADKSIFIPTYQGQRGHPALMDWRHVAGMRALPADQGLNVYLRQHLEETLEVPVESAEVLFDLDTPEDVAALEGRRHLANRIRGGVPADWAVKLGCVATAMSLLGTGAMLGLAITGDRMWLDRIPGTALLLIACGILLTSAVISRLIWAPKRAARDQMNSRNESSPT
jgi:molybdenum cofactor cytidylyltransferase